ncbi:endonuclease domain-containing protein [Nocardia africana]
MYKYNLSPEGYSLIEGADSCPGCERRFDETVRRYIDHCHETGAVRAALCRECNLVLGQVRDSPETLRRLADYLEVKRMASGPQAGVSDNDRLPPAALP